MNEMKQLVIIVRSLKRSSRLNIINLVSMALGLVAAGIILGYVYQEFHYDSANLYSENIYRVEPSGYAPMTQVLETDFPEVQEATRVGFFYGYLACSAGENKFNETSAIFADPNFFDLFSFPFVKGNRKECLNAPNTIVLSEAAAHKYFGDDDPIGQLLKIGGDREFTVTGVYQDFQANSNFKGDLVLPLKVISKLTQIWVDPSWEYASDIHTFVLMADQANIQELSRKSEGFFSKYTSEIKSGLEFQPLKDIHVDKQIVWESTPQINVTYLYILVAIAFLILVISSANFLFLYIGIKAQRKVNTGVKKVCGASRSTLVAEYFREVLILMFLSVVLALVFYILYQFTLTNFVPFLPAIAYFDFNLGLIFMAVIFLVVLLAGLYPSLVLSSQKPVQIFSSQKQESPGKVRLINKLVIVQFSLCILFIVTTIFMYKQVHYMEKQDPGFAKDELITIPLNMHIGQGIYSEKFGAFAEELKKYPEIKDVTMAYASPSFVNNTGDTPDWEGKPDGKEVKMYWGSVSYDYFRTLGVKVLQGRTFNADFPSDQVNWDNHTGAYILNKSAVEAMGIKDPIGKEFKVWGFKGSIIGVVDDYNCLSMRSSVSPMFFMVNPFFLNEIIVRVNPHAPSLLPDIQKVWNQFVPEYPVDFHFVDDQIKALYKPEQNLADALNLFSILAILIAAMGLFTLTILSMNQRTKEIGIRKVNGAKISEVMSMLNKDFIKWVVIAYIIATPVAWYAVDQWLKNFAYKTNLSWWVFALAGVLALGIALLTVSFQSWKAATRNPVEALRYE